MRFKAIPKEIVTTAKAHPWAVVIGVVAIGGLLLIANGNTGDVVEINSDAGYIGDSYPLMGTSLVGGLSLNGGGSGAGFDNAALIGIEQQKASNDQELGLQQLQLQGDIAANNFELGKQSITAANFATSAMLATSMLASQSTSLLASFMLPNGENINFGLAQTKTSGSKLKSRNNAIAASNAQGITALNDFIKMTGSSANVPLSTTGSAANIISGVPVTPLPSNAGTSNQGSTTSAGNGIAGNFAGNGAAANAGLVGTA